MTEPSSRTPEGIPHHCGTCGGAFNVDVSMAGDACCPNCNALVWPAGPEQLHEPSERPDLGRELQHRRRTRGSDPAGTAVKRFRIRPQTPERDIEYKLKTAARFLAEHNSVQVEVMLRGREMAHAEDGQRMLARWIEALVPEYANLESAPDKRGRRIACRFVPR